MNIENHLTKEMIEAVLEIMKEFGSLEKKGRNKHAGYDFAPVDAFYNRAVLLLHKHRLLITSNEVESELVPMTASLTDKSGNIVGGKTTIWIKTKWVFNIHHNGISSRDFTRFVFVPTSGPQTEGIAQSYASKNFMRELFKIRTGEYELDDMSPTEHGIPETSEEKSNVPHDPETGEVKQDSKAIARSFYEDITLEKRHPSELKTISDMIDKRLDGNEITKSQYDALQKVLHARKMIVGTNTIEELERSQEAVDAVPTVFRGDLEKLLEARKAEIPDTSIQGYER